MGAESNAKAACHSARTDREQAEALQGAALDPVTLEPLDESVAP